MSVKAFYIFHFSDASIEVMEPSKAYAHAKEKGLEITKDGYQIARDTYRRTPDGFKPGFNPGLGCEVRDRGHYRQLLKEKKLVEMGDQYARPTKPETKFFDDKLLREIKEVAPDANVEALAKTGIDFAT